MKMMQGAFARACSNRSRTRAAPTPTNISTNSDPEMEKNGTPASPATALARSVLPVPGGPTSKTPFGMRAPSRPCSFGFFRNETTSCNSAFDSSTPATSAKVTFVSVSTYTLAFDLPMAIRPPPPGPPSCFAMRRPRKIQMPKNNAVGTIHDSSMAMNRNSEPSR